MCQFCQSTEVVFSETPQLPHYGREDCADCGRFIRWVPKPEGDRVRRPSAHRGLVHKFSRGFCEMCLRKENELPDGQTLEAQHVEEFSGGGEPKRENIWIICTACHKLIHCIRTHFAIRKAS